MVKYKTARAYSDRNEAGVTSEAPIARAMARREAVSLKNRIRVSSCGLSFREMKKWKGYFLRLPF